MWKWVVALSVQQHLWVDNKRMDYKCTDLFSSLLLCEFQAEVVAATMAEVVTRPGGQTGREALDKEELGQTVEGEYLEL